MKPTTLITVIVLCLAFCGRAGAQTTTGADIQNKCKELTANKAFSFDGGFCAGFMDGIIADETMWHLSDDVQKQTHILSFCLPETGTNGQYLQVLVKYLDEHPEELHKPAAFLLREAFNKAFPCGK